MIVGMIVRAEDRGLGHLTWEAARAIKPAAIVAIDMGEWARGFPPHAERYPPELTTWATFDGHAPRGEHLDVMAVADAFTDCDVVWSAETFYDWRLVRELHRRRIRTVIHTMPEFHREECNAVPNVWLPTPWLAERHPGAPVVPIGVALDRFEHVRPADPFEDGPLRVLHVAGHRAAMDRNGTQTVVESTAHMQQQVHVTIRTQDAEVASPSPGPHVTTDVQRLTGGDYWDAYDGHHVLLLPRRYGGLSLPAQEALGAGLGVVMPACEPNEWWPTVRVHAHRSTALQAPAGEIRTYGCDARDVAQAIDFLASHRDDLANAQRLGRAWAEAMAWDNVVDEWMTAFDHARLP